MKTVIEVQHNNHNVTVTDIKKQVVADLRKKGIKQVEIDDLHIYYMPESLEMYYVAKKRVKDDNIIFEKGELLFSKEK